MKKNITLLIVISIIAYIFAVFGYGSINPWVWDELQRRDVLIGVIFVWAFVVGARYCT